MKKLTAELKDKYGKGFDFSKGHSAGFHTAEAKGIWKEYTESYYQMDTYYCLFHLIFSLNFYQKDAQEIGGYMKKFIMFLLLLACGLGLTGCLGKSDKADIGQPSVKPALG